jgi:steroid delta-isomerase-like uncharacterized protein
MLPSWQCQQKEIRSIVITRKALSTNRTDSLIRRMFENAFNQGTFAVVDELVAPDGVTHTPSWGMPNTRQGLKQLIAMFRTAFPDLHCTVEDEISAGDKVAAHWTIRGTHKGPVLGNRPTNRPIVVQGIIFARIESGRIAEGWALLDQMGMLQQLGIVPPPRY